MRFRAKFWHGQTFLLARGARQTDRETKRTNKHKVFTKEQKDTYIKDRETNNVSNIKTEIRINRQEDRTALKLKTDMNLETINIAFQIK